MRIALCTFIGNLEIYYAKRLFLKGSFFYSLVIIKYFNEDIFYIPFKDCTS